MHLKDPIPLFLKSEQKISTSFRQFGQAELISNQSRMLYERKMLSKSSVKSSKRRNSCSISLGSKKPQFVRGCSLSSGNFVSKLLQHNIHRIKCKREKPKENQIQSMPLPSPQKNPTQKHLTSQSASMDISSYLFSPIVIILSCSN